MSIKDNIKDILSLRAWFNKSICHRGHNQGQFVLDSTLFDWKTAPWRKLLIINHYSFAFKHSDDFYASPLSPIWKQLNQNQAIIQHVQKVPILTSKMDSSENEHE